jgi:hypothetical protein
MPTEIIINHNLNIINSLRLGWRNMCELPIFFENHQFVLLLLMYIFWRISDSRFTWIHDLKESLTKSVGPVPFSAEYLICRHVRRMDRWADKLIRVGLGNLSVPPGQPAYMKVFIWSQRMILSVHLTKATIVGWMIETLHHHTSVRKKRHLCEDVIGWCAG